MKNRQRQSQPAKKRLDIRDVARHANVSIATVSRAMNRVPTVDKELAERVWKSIEGLSYYPNTQARALVSGRSRLFGLLVSEITNPFFPELIEGFEEVAVESGYDIMIGSTNHDVARMRTCVRRLLERSVEGVAVMTFGIEAPLLDEFASRNVPLVFIDVGPENPRASTITVNYLQGIREGVRHLAGMAHREIAFVSGPMQQPSCQRRQAAFLTSLAEAGLVSNPELLLEGDHTLAGGMRAAEQLLQRENLPTAVMCSNDMTAIGVLRVFANTGIRVPDDVSVIGFDDIHLAEFVYPPLTTVHMSRTAIARAAVEALRADVEGTQPANHERNQTIATRLTVRQSTGLARAAPENRTSRGKRAASVPRPGAARTKTRRLI
jgi:DNA-binding LacI/PurR family transcriptional regulator